MRTIRMSSMLALLLVGLCVNVWAQEDKSKRPSPPAIVSGKIGDATVTINYSSPSVKGRKVWDPNAKIAPYGKVWRAGANEATVFETSKDIKVEGQTLPAGKYGFFAIPGEKEWTIIFNNEPNQWGAYKYDQANDKLRVKVKSQTSGQLSEKLVYDVTSHGIILRWENVEVPVTIN